MLTQSNEFREQLLALLYRFGMPKSTESFTLTCEGSDAFVLLSATFAPECEAENTDAGVGLPEASDLVEVWPIGAREPQFMRGRAAS